MRVLIVLPGALGDVVRALPLLGRLRRGCPEAEIGWVVEPLSAPVLAAHPWLDRLHIFARRRGLRGLRALVREVRPHRYDIALDLGRSAKSALITLGSGAPRRIGFSRADSREGNWLAATERVPPQPPGRSKLEQFLTFGDRLGLPATPVEFGLVASEHDRARIAAALSGLPDPVLAVPVGSSCPSRRWFPDRTAALVRAVHAVRPCGVVLLGTSADRPFAAAVQRAAPGPLRDLTGATTVGELVAALERSAVVVGPDSGALHLAAALGRPVVSLWGATSAARSAPWGSEARVVVGASPCAPCFLRDCPIGRVCMEAISVADVARRVVEALAG